MSVIESISRSRWREEFVHANGVRQHIWRTGGSGPVVVALPGFQEIGLTWARFAKRIERELDVIMVDFRGQGRTERGSEQYSQSLLVRDMTELLRELGIPRASVIGFSNGAGVAAELAATRPDLLACAVLEDPPRNTARTAAMGESPRYRAWHASWLKWLEEFKALSPEARVAAIGTQIPGGGGDWPNEEIVPFAESYGQLDIEFVRDPATLWKVANRSVTDLVAEIRCPTLLVEATKLPPGMQAPAPMPEAPTLPPNVIRVQFETGHFVRREQFERYVDTVLPFLREHAD
jgi:pimeloyl-ACP methyl ester carboxylesterase